MPFQHIFQNIPDHRILPVNDLFRRLHSLDNSSFDKLSDNERLEEFSCHVFGQSTLMQFQLRTHNDNRATGIVNAFTEEVLTEAALLSFQHIAEGFQSAVSI